jgi:UDP-N-acetylmuramoyl-L-alanyl-D-glutamate--2,6-diaminopimelate ligase
MAKLAAEKASVVVISNEDPYEDDPQSIVDDLSEKVASFGKTKDVDLFPIFDRREGIAKALSVAQKGDIVLITGKGAEQTMMVKGGAIPWNERAIVRELVKNYVHTHERRN